MTSLSWMFPLVVFLCSLCRSSVDLRLCVYYICFLCSFCCKSSFSRVYPCPFPNLALRQILIPTVNTFERSFAGEGSLQNNSKGSRKIRRLTFSRYAAAVCAKWALVAHIPYVPVRFKPEDLGDGKFPQSQSSVSSRQNDNISRRVPLEF